MKVGTDAVLLCGYAYLDDKEANNEIWVGDVEYVCNLAILEKEKKEYLLKETETETEMKGLTSNAMRILEIGSGSGVITLLLAQHYPNALIDAIDIDHDAINQTKVNISNCPFQHWKKRIRVFHSSVQDFLPLPPAPPSIQENDNTSQEISTEGTKGEDTEISTQVYDLIVCAPPYFKSDENTEMITRMNKKRRRARHTHTLPMSDLISCVGRLLKKDTGRFKTIFSLPYPEDEFSAIAPTQHLVCLEKVYVKDNPSTDNPIRMMGCYYIPKEKPKADDVPQAPKERKFSIYTASYKDLPQMHRPYTNQYKWLVKDFCAHFVKE